MKTHIRLLLISLFLLGQPAFADSALIKRQADEISGSIMSPYCPGRLLRDCPSGQAAQLKETIEDRLHAGEAKQTILEDLIATFGESMRAAPKAEGFGLLAWITPGAFLLLGAVLIFFWLRKRSAQLPDTDEGALNPEEQARVDSELLNSR